LRMASMPLASAWVGASLRKPSRLEAPCVVAQFCLSFQSGADAFTGPTCTASMAPLIEPGALIRPKDMVARSEL
jgi:hypothetical protein